MYFMAYAYILKHNYFIFETFLGDSTFTWFLFKLICSTEIKDAYYSKD